MSLDSRNYCNGLYKGLEFQTFVDLAGLYILIPRILQSQLESLEGLSHFVQRIQEFLDQWMDRKKYFHWYRLVHISLHKVCSNMDFQENLAGKHTHHSHLGHIP